MSSTSQQPPVTRTILSRLPIPALPGYETRTVLLDYAPGASAQPHTHPVDGINFIIQGSVLSQWEGQTEPEHFKAGEIFLDYANKLHTKVENPSRTERLKVVVTYVLPTEEEHVKFP